MQANQELTWITKTNLQSVSQTSTVQELKSVTEEFHGILVQNSVIYNNEQLHCFDSSKHLISVFFRWLCVSLWMDWRELRWSRERLSFETLSWYFTWTTFLFLNLKPLELLLAIASLSSILFVFVDIRNFVKFPVRIFVPVSWRLFTYILILQALRRRTPVLETWLYTSFAILCFSGKSFLNCQFVLSWLNVIDQLCEFYHWLTHSAPRSLVKAEGDY